MKKVIFLCVSIMACGFYAIGHQHAAAKEVYTYSGLDTWELQFDLEAQRYTEADSTTKVVSCNTKAELNCVTFDSTALFAPSTDNLNLTKGVTEFEHQSLGFRYTIEAAKVRILGKVISGYSVISSDTDSPITANFFYSVKGGVVMFEHSYRTKETKGFKSLSVLMFSTSEKGLFSK